MHLAVDRIDSPAGPIVLVANAIGLVAADFGEPEDRLWQMLRADSARSRSSRRPTQWGR